MKKGIIVQWDDKEVHKNMDELNEQIKKQSFLILKNSSKAFVNAAVKSTPPFNNKGRKKSVKQMYNRSFVPLIRLIAKKYSRLRPTKEDYEKYHQGYRFKVFGKKNSTYGYAKTKRELKQLLRIETRMLLKTMWGKNIQSLGVSMPSSIRTLLNRSPKLKSMNYNDMRMQKSQNADTLSITNKATGIERVFQMAKRNGENAAVSYINRMLKFKMEDIQKKHKEL